MSGRIRVNGLRELNRAFAQIDKDLKRELTRELREAAEPVQREAEALAKTKIRNITPRWSGMRIGSTQRVVYVAPRARRRGGSPRPNLASLLLQRAMLPAVERNTEKVVDRLDDLLDRLGRKAGF